MFPVPVSLEKPGLAYYCNARELEHEVAFVRFVWRTVFCFAVGK